MKRSVLVLLAALLLTAKAGFCGQLYDRYAGKAEVKVFVDLPVDKSGKGKVVPQHLKESLEEALKGRKSIRFAVVPERGQADLAVSTEVVEFYWTDHDPVDMIVGVGGTAMDAMVVEDYVRMRAMMSVAEVKNGRELWKKEVLSTITKSGMPEADAPALIDAGLAKDFVIEAFGKKKTGNR